MQNTEPDYILNVAQC